MNIDADIREYVDGMNCSTLGQQVAIEVTLQEKRNREEPLLHVPSPNWYRPTVAQINHWWEDATSG